MDAPPGPNSALADRRWLIGIGISLVFGIFGAVMAVLSYTDRGRSQAPLAGPAIHAAPAAPAPAPHGHGKNRERE